MSKVAQAQMARLREKITNRINTRPPRPPLMAAIAGPYSYKDITLKPGAAWQVKATPGQQQIPLPQPETKSHLIHRKFQEILTRSTRSNPICLKCGSSGHIASGCRNATLCFICNKFGHKARECTAITVSFPPTPPLKLRKPRSITERREAFQSRRLRPTASMVTPLRTPIVTLTPTAESELIEQQFQLSFVLDDIAGWGPEKVEQVMQRRFRRADHRWIATVYEEFQYLIQAPTKVWLDSVASRGFLVLDGVEFPVLAWEPAFEEGLDLIPVWVRLRGFPKSQWAWVELEKVFNPLGAHLLELDPGTGARYDWRFIRAKFGVCDPKLLPAIHYVEKLSPSGKIKVFDISIEIENENTESVHAWRSRLNGRPYPNGTEFGLLGDVDNDTDQIRVEVPAATVGEGLEVNESVNGDAEMEEEQSVQVGGITPGCKPGAGGSRKRDEEDGDAPDSGKKGSVGSTPKRVGKPSSSGTKSVLKSAPKAGGSSSRPTKKPTSSAPAATPIPLSPNFFQPLSDDNHLPLSDDLLHTPAAENTPLPTHSIISGMTMKRTWGSRKKTSPIILKKRLTLGGSARRKSGAAAAATGPQPPSLTTPEAEESPADKRVGTRKSLREQREGSANEEAKRKREGRVNGQPPLHSDLEVTKFE
ncbi:Cellular nucleic acid-binding protein [Carex littledalei]|uniref:Cellular nucleic acid-binding protein n=1 Tax=Carex littledalei TaxID=544730 RepID=A0A833Q948_9POAL|nr:Cellular nucleic acid-binding protein [Carex littledalei]